MVESSRVYSCSIPNHGSCMPHTHSPHILSDAACMGTHMRRQNISHLSSSLGHHLGTCCTGVSGDGDHVCNHAVLGHLGGLVAVAHHEDVVPPAEGVLVNGAGYQEHLRIITRSLSGG